MDQQLLLAILLACCSALRGALSMLSEDIAAARSFLHFSMHRPCSVHLSYCRQITDEALIGVCWHRARASTSSLFRSAWHDWAKF